VQGLPITVYGDGEQTRDFLYVGDLVQVMVQALEQPQVEEGAVNIGLNQATSINQMLAALQKVVGSLPAVTYAAAGAGDIRHSRADNQRLLARFAFPQATPMVEGLARLLGKS